MKGENRWENKHVAHLDAHYTRIIASWVNVGGTLSSRNMGDFKEWLEALGLSEDERYDVIIMATCGKLELELHARRFLNAKKYEKAQAAEGSE